MGARIPGISTGMEQEAWGLDAWVLTQLWEARGSGAGGQGARTPGFHRGSCSLVVSTSFLDPDTPSSVTSQPRLSMTTGHNTPSGSSGHPGSARRSAFSSKVTPSPSPTPCPGLRPHPLSLSLCSTPQAARTAGTGTLSLRSRCSGRRREGKVPAPSQYACQHSSTHSREPHLSRVIGFHPLIFIDS